MFEELYIVIHGHRYGTSVYLVRSNHYPTDKEVIKYCKILFEPEREESLNIDRYYEDTIITIPPKKTKRR